MTAPKRLPGRTAEELLSTKLMPPRLQPTMLRRPKLLAHLDGALTRKLTLLSAPTGFGKTTLAGMWIEGADFPCAWVTLDATDNDPTRFWTYAVSALRTVDASIGKTTLSALMAPQPASLQTLLTPLINDLGRLNGPAVLVLEDYQTITAKEISEGLAFLVQHLPAQVHILLITRADPDLPLPLLRVRGELLEIDGSSLRFDLEEIESFLRLTAGVDLSPSTLAELQKKTEGWPAGLRLIALSLQKKGGQADVENLVRSFSGGERYVADYLIQEVFASQPEAAQGFLLKTCFFSRLTGSLCDAITGVSNGSSWLEKLERENLFVTRLEHVGPKTWYRYNPLFAESIQHLARQRLAEASIQDLFEEASGWYEAHGLDVDAIETALAAGLFDRAIPLIERYIEIHELRELGTLSRWLEAIPGQEILRHALICLTYAEVILYSGDRFAPATAIRIEPYLRAAETAWRAEENHPRLGQLLSFRGNVVWWQGDFSSAFAYARQSLQELPEYDVASRGNSLLILGNEALNGGRILDAQDLVLEARALLGAARNTYGVLATLQMLGEVFYWQGELEPAEQLNHQIIAEAVGDESMLDDQGIAALNLARIAYERNELDVAEDHATRAVELGKERANEFLQVQATLQVADIYAARPDHARARELVQALEARIQTPVFLHEIRTTLALLALRAGDRSTLEVWERTASANDQSVLELQEERDTFVLARLRLEQGRAQEALEILGDRKRKAAQNGRIRGQVQALVLESLAQHAARDLRTASEPLIAALTIGRAKGFRRIFLDEGPRLAALIQAALPTLRSRPLNLYATTLLHSFPAEASGHLAAADLPGRLEPLSPQELRVLRLLVAGRSNTEIAQEQVVSTNTIKTQVKSIYRKLNVNSRDEAREAARELKLV